MAPLVLPVVLTTHGEFCKGAIELQEWLVEKYRLRLLPAIVFLCYSAHG